MRIDSLFYRLAYRREHPRWDNPAHGPTWDQLVGDRPAGRALDLGCGTGNAAIHLSSRGWDVVGVDFVPRAIATASARARAAGSSARFVLGDVTRLRDAGVDGDFQLLIDVGCFHSIPERLRDDYARGVAQVAAPGADFYLMGIAEPPASWKLVGAQGVTMPELRRRFADSFEVNELASDMTDGGSPFRLYHLVRRARVA
jgi:SAM-dependent methyltransferase